MKTEEKISFLQFAGRLQRKKYPSRNLQDACRGKNILPAICRELAEEKISFPQFAGSLQGKKYPSCNLQDACRGKNILPAICRELAEENFSMLKNENTLNKNQ